MRPNGARPNGTLTCYNDRLSATSVANNAALRATIRETEAELRQQDNNDTAGARVRSHIGWHGRGELSLCANGETAAEGFHHTSTLSPQYSDFSTETSDQSFHF